MTTRSTPNLQSTGVGFCHSSDAPPVLDSETLQCKAPTNPEPSLSWNCSDCALGYQSEADLTRHINENHAHQNFVIIPYSQTPTPPTTAHTTPTGRSFKPTNSGHESTNGWTGHSLSKCWRCSNFVLADEIDSHVVSHEDYWQHRWELQFSSSIPTNVLLQADFDFEKTRNPNPNPLAGQNDDQKPCLTCDKCKMLFHTSEDYSIHLKWDHDRILNDPSFVLHLQPPSPQTQFPPQNPSINTVSSSNATSYGKSSKLKGPFGSLTRRNQEQLPISKPLARFDYRGGSGFDPIMAYDMVVGSDNEFDQDGTSGTDPGPGRGDLFYNEGNFTNLHRNSATSRSSNGQNQQSSARNGSNQANRRQPAVQAQDQTERRRPGPQGRLIRDPDNPNRVLCFPCNRYLAQNRVKHTALHTAYDVRDPRSPHRCTACSIAFDSLAALTRHQANHVDGPCNEQGAGRSTDPRYQNQPIRVQTKNPMRDQDLSDNDNDNDNLSDDQEDDRDMSSVGQNSARGRAKEARKAPVLIFPMTNEEIQLHNTLTASRARSGGEKSPTLMIEGIRHTFCGVCFRYVRRIDLHEAQHRNYDEMQSAHMHCCFDCQLGFHSQRGFDAHMAEHPKITKAPYLPQEFSASRLNWIRTRAKRVADHSSLNLSSTLGSINMNDFNTDRGNNESTVAKITAKDMVVDEENFQPYSCSRCSVFVPNVARQKVHLMIHYRYDEGEAEWRCDICAVAWESEGKWKNHLESVGHLEHKQRLEREKNPIATFKCNRCNRDWPISYQRTHDRLHKLFDASVGKSGATIKNCIICELGWEDQIGLDAHNEEVHGSAGGGRSSRRNPK